MRAWRKTPPTAPGWYWCRDPELAAKPGCVDAPDIVEVCLLHSALCVFSDARDEWIMVSEYACADAEWLGPITPEDVARADTGGIQVWPWTIGRGLVVTTNDMGGCDFEVDPEILARADAFEPVTFGWETEPCITQAGVKFTGEGMIERHQQYQADAAVGRKLREISEKVGWKHKVQVTFENGDLEVLFIGNQSAYTAADGPDALDRAHAEVCGDGGLCWMCGARTPNGVQAICDGCRGDAPPFPAKGVRGRDSAPPAPAEPNPLHFKCKGCGKHVALGVSDGEGNCFCRDCWDARDTHARPDYASMDDDDLLAACGCVPDGGGNIRIDDRRDALRAALIAFIEQCPTKPAR